MTIANSLPDVNPALTPDPLAAPVASRANLTRNSRAERARMPVALHVAEDVAIQHGVCIRPITQRVTDTYTGEVTLVDVPCGATLESKCPPCAQRAKRLRMHQCRAGWHADTDPIPDEDPANDPQRDLVAVRADVTSARDELLDLGDVDSAEAAAETLELLDTELAELGVRGRLEPDRWPATNHPLYTGDTQLPIWDEDAPTEADCGGYLDPASGAYLPTWDQALDDLDELGDVEPQHVVRFGAQADIKGLISGTPDADRRIGYLAKYLTKDIAHCHQDTDGDLAVAGHTDRLVEALRYEPCSPTCANWLRYGIQPKNARPGMTPGACKAKAHKREHLGYGGRRVLVSRKWSGKTLTDHRHERRAFVLALLGIDPTTQAATAGDKTSDRYVWEPINPSEAPPLATRLLHAITQRQTWIAAYESARAGNGPPAVNTPLILHPAVSATEGN
jgi:hypothetical protein